MKKLLLIPVTLLLLALTASLVLADDPMEVDLVVVTPDDVDLDVGINAGGDVDITIDGVDYKQVATTAQGAYDRAWSSGFTTGDFWIYWNLSGIGSMIGNQIAELQGLTGLLLNAEAKLIEGHELTAKELSSVSVAVTTLKNSVMSQILELDEETSATFAGLQDRDEVIWNQLMYGAEAHIAILEGKVNEQSVEISGLQSQAVALSTELEASRADHTNLLGYTSYLQKQYLYYFWILSGVITLLAMLLLVSHLRNRAR